MSVNNGVIHCKHEHFTQTCMLQVITCERDETFISDCFARARELKLFGWVNLKAATTAFKTYLATRGWMLSDSYVSCKRRSTRQIHGWMGVSGDWRLATRLCRGSSRLRCGGDLASRWSPHQGVLKIVTFSKEAARRRSYPVRPGDVQAVTTGPTRQDLGVCFRVNKHAHFWDGSSANCISKLMVPVRVVLVMVPDCANVRVREEFWHILSPWWRILAPAVEIRHASARKWCQRVSEGFAYCYAAAIEMRGWGRRDTSRRRVGCADPWRAQSSVLQTHSVAGELLLARRSRCGCCVNAFRCAFCQGSCRDEGNLGRGAPRPEWLQM